MSIQSRPMPVRAAQYLRMSTEHQRYSIAHQTEVVAEYAAANGMQVVRSYSDKGISGLTLKERAGLQSLLTDVLGGDPGFEVVLVYDVSRWGRFQNPDQSAHYEFLCEENGVRVEYCAESFVNDGSVGASLLKGLKRVMAAQYSRDLSLRVSSAHRVGALEGNWQGGSAGYGLRRQVVDDKGNPGPVLQHGQAKAVQGHRVRLIHGPPEEIAVVRRIFRMFVSGLKPQAISQILNDEGVPATNEAGWTRDCVRQLLANEKYAGTLVTGRTHSSVGKRERTPESAWVRVTGALKPIIDRRTFEDARRLLNRRTRFQDDAVMLEVLRNLLSKHGRLSKRIINEDHETPHSSAYIAKFGSMQATYDLIGYAQERVTGPRTARRADAELLEHLKSLLRSNGYLSASLINSTTGAPSVGTYINRFGSLRQAYAQIGYVRITVREQSSPIGRARAEAVRMRAFRD